MKCPACEVTVKFEWEAFVVTEIEKGSVWKNNLLASGFCYNHANCPACGTTVIMREVGQLGIGFDLENTISNIFDSEIIYPLPKQQFELGDEVPSKYKKVFNEAQSVISLSPNSSAALSRKNLQMFIRDEFKIKEKNLALEIDRFIEKENPPMYIAETLHVVRSFGNISVHTTKDKVTGEIIDVEDGEAEWLLEIMNSLFDYHFVVPERHRKRIESLNRKLQSAGKQPLKEVK